MDLHSDGFPVAEHGSSIIAPTGEIIAQADGGDTETIITAEGSLDAIT